jgi:cytochrome c oxidase cbb3-type subunit 2
VPSSGGTREPEHADGGEGRWAFAALVAAFFALVAVDSAAFAAIQRSPALAATSWGGAGLQLRQGLVHLVAALAAGLAIDRAGVRAVLPVAGALFVAALPSIDAGGPLAHLAAVLYAAAISIYSAALVAAPSESRRGGLAGARVRAAWLYAVAGWIGSGLGVAAADRLAPAAAPVAAAESAASESTAQIARGRAVYLAEGCQHCHSQYVRPATRDEPAWGPRRPLDRSERPPTPGNRRIGPDLANAGLRRSALWHELHLRDPRSVSPGSRMPSYAHLFAGDGRDGRALVAYLAALGAGAERERAAAIAAVPVPTGGGEGARGRELFARHCAPCHGVAGRGDGALAARLPRPLLDLGRGELARAVPARPGESPDAALARVVRFGLPPGTMPGHEWLSDREVADLVAFVRELVEAGRRREAAG